MSLPKKPQEQISTLDDFITGSDENIKTQTDKNIKIQEDKLIPITVQISPDLRHKLRRAALELNCFQRDIVRDALTQYLASLSF